MAAVICILSATATAWEVRAVARLPLLASIAAKISAIILAWAAPAGAFPRDRVSVVMAAALARMVPAATSAAMPSIMDLAVKASAAAVSVAPGSAAQVAVSAAVAASGVVVLEAVASVAAVAVVALEAAVSAAVAVAAVTSVDAAVAAAGLAAVAAARMLRSSRPIRLCPIRCPWTAVAHTAMVLRMVAMVVRMVATGMVESIHIAMAGLVSLVRWVMAALAISLARMDMIRLTVATRPIA